MTAKEIQRRIERIVEIGNKTPCDTIKTKSISTDCGIVLSYIKKAFHGVQCVNERNVLLCCEALDDYAPDDLLEQIGVLEERTDWQRLSANLLNECDCALSYAGPEAFRFLIPAFMCAYIQYDISPDIPLKLSIFEHDNDEVKDYFRYQCSLLNQNQQSAISLFMAQMRIEEEDVNEEEDDNDKWSDSYGLLPWEWDEYHHYYRYLSTIQYKKLLNERYISLLREIEI